MYWMTSILISQWHLTMHFNWRDDSSVAVNVLSSSPLLWYYRRIFSHYHGITVRFVPVTVTTAVKYIVLSPLPYSSLQCTTPLHKTSWPVRRNSPRQMSRPFDQRQRRWDFFQRRDVSTSWDGLETEMSRLRPHPCSVMTDICNSCIYRKLSHNLSES